MLRRGKDSNNSTGFVTHIGSGFRAANNTGGGYDDSVMGIDRAGTGRWSG